MTFDGEINYKKRTEENIEMPEISRTQCKDHKIKIAKTTTKTTNHLNRTHVHKFTHAHVYITVTHYAFSVVLTPLFSIGILRAVAAFQIYYPLLFATVLRRPLLVVSENDKIRLHARRTFIDVSMRISPYLHDH